MLKIAVALVSTVSVFAFLQTATIPALSGLVLIAPALAADRGDPIACYLIAVRGIQEDYVSGRITLDEANTRHEQVAGRCEKAGPMLGKVE